MRDLSQIGGFSRQEPITAPASCHVQRNSGWDVNGPQVFRAFHWKILGYKWNCER